MEQSEVVLAMLMQAAAPIAVQLTAMDPEGASEDRLAINVEKAFLAVLNVYGPINAHWDEEKASAIPPPTSIGGSSSRLVRSARRR